MLKLRLEGLKITGEDQGVSNKWNHMYKNPGMVKKHVQGIERPVSVLAPTGQEGERYRVKILQEEDDRQPLEGHR